MLGRRKENRGSQPDRRDLPRPSLRLTLSVLILAVASLSFTMDQRREIDAGYAKFFNKAAGPSELEQVKAELAELDVSNEALKTELVSRRAYLESFKSRDFYLSIDTEKKKLTLNYGNEVVREAALQIGTPVTVAGPTGKTWTFVALKGAFNVAGKEEGLPWRVPPWVYSMNKQAAPVEAPLVVNGLGKYVVLLPNDYVIHSPPARGSPLKGPKPGSFMIPEADFQAIWDRITPETRVYIF